MTAGHITARRGRARERKEIGMFESLGHLVYRRRRVVLGLAAGFVVIAVVWGTGVFGRLSGGGFEDPNSESSRAVAVAEDRLGRQATDVVVVYTDRLAAASTTRLSRVRSRARSTGLPADQVASVTSYWSTGGAPQFASDDGQSTYACGATDRGRRGRPRGRIRGDRRRSGRGRPARPTRGGAAPTFVAVNDQVSEDIAARRDALAADPARAAGPDLRQRWPRPACRWPIGVLAILGAFTAAADR